VGTGIVIKRPWVHLAAIVHKMLLLIITVLPVFIFVLLEQFSGFTPGWVSNERTCGAEFAQPTLALLYDRPNLAQMQ